MRWKDIWRQDDLHQQLPSSPQALPEYGHLERGSALHPAPQRAEPVPHSGASYSYGPYSYGLRGDDLYSYGPIPHSGAKYS